MAVFPAFLLWRSFVSSTDMVHPVVLLGFADGQIYLVIQIYRGLSYDSNSVSHRYFSLHIMPVNNRIFREDFYLPRLNAPTLMFAFVQGSSYLQC